MYGKRKREKGHETKKPAREILVVEERKREKESEKNRKDREKKYTEWRKEAGLSLGPLKLVKENLGINGPYGLARRNGNSEPNLKILLKTPS